MYNCLLVIKNLILLFTFVVNFIHAILAIALQQYSNRKKNQVQFIAMRRESPSILVLASSGATDSLERSHLTPTDLFAPFTTAPDRLSRSIRFVSPADRAVDLSVGGFSVRLVSGTGLRDAIEKRGHSGNGDDVVYENKVEEYCAGLHERLRYAKTEFLDQPIGCLVLLDSQNISESVEMVQRLTSIKAWPSYFRHRYYDAKSIVFAYVLLVDERAGTVNEEM
jgi:hypothetical protein